MERIKVSTAMFNWPMFNWLRPKPQIVVNFNDGAFLEIMNEAPEHEVLMAINGEIMHRTEIAGKHWTRANRRYFSHWELSVKDPNGKSIFTHGFDLAGKRVRINIDSKSLGDTLAWLPQVGRFAQVHPDATVFVSQFWQDLFDQSAYPLLEFIDPESNVENCYATYNIGYYFDQLDWYHPEDPRQQPLAKVASDILGILYTEIKPVLTLPQSQPSQHESPYVCIATASTAACKEWQREGGWQQVVDYLNDIGFRVMLIQKEQTSLRNIDNQSGNQPIQTRIEQLLGCTFFIGLGSGLSWLAWALAKPVVLISGFSEPHSEFLDQCQRIINTEVCHGCWNDTSVIFDRGDWDWCPRHKGTDRQFECTKKIMEADVLSAIQRLVTDTGPISV